MSVQNRFLALDKDIISDIYTSTEVMDNLVILCDDFGSRFGGTESERQAAEFIQMKFQEYGLSNVHREPIDYVGWTRGEACLEIISPVHKVVPCISLPHSPPANLEGIIIDLEDGAPEDFELRAAEIKDKIVMTTSIVTPKRSKRWIHRSEKYGRSLLAGAGGFIFVNQYPGYGPATGGIGLNGEAPIPGISVCKEDGAFIQRLIKRRGPVTIRLTTTDKCIPMTSWNIVGDLPGQADPEQIIMLGSHYDGHDISQGARDPASGTVAVMEAARVLAKYATNLPYTIRFVSWGIEEIGLIGSRHHVEKHADQLSKIRFYLNMDSAGGMKNKDIVLNEWLNLQPYFEMWRDEMTLDFDIEQSLHTFSDHFPFFMEGVPTGGIEPANKPLIGRGYGHTRYDTVDKISLLSLREAADLGARLAIRIASETDWPVAQRTKEAVLQLLDNPDYQEETIFKAQLDSFFETLSTH